MKDKPKENTIFTQDNDVCGELPSSVLQPQDGKRWFVIRSKPRQEAVCLTELRKADIEAACPYRMEYRFRRRRQEAVPLFPGYVFGKFAYPEEYHSVRWLKGVLHLVRFGEAPPPAVDDSVMRYFIENMNESGVIETGPDYKVGDKVEFLTESLKGLVGTVMKIDSAERRIHVLMDLLYQATIEVDSYQVQAV